MLVSLSIEFTATNTIANGSSLSPQCENSHNFLEGDGLLRTGPMASKSVETLGPRTWAKNERERWILPDRNGPLAYGGPDRVGP